MSKAIAKGLKVVVTGSDCFHSFSIGDIITALGDENRFTDGTEDQYMMPDDYVVMKTSENDDVLAADKVNDVLYRAVVGDILVTDTGKAYSITVLDRKDDACPVKLVTLGGSNVYGSWGAWRFDVKDASPTLYSKVAQ